MNKIGIVGSGPSALYTLQALLRATQPLHIVMFEADATAGMGIPYNPANTDPSMLANIASIELPPLGISLEDWLRERSDGELARLNLERSAIGPREFFPRVVLGDYFAHQLKAMIATGERLGHRVEVRTRHRVTDVVARRNGIRITTSTPAAGLRHHMVHRIVIATGHRAARARTGASLPLREAYQAVSARDMTGAIGVLGTSLSGIDVAVATASRHGAFERGGKTLRFVPHADAAPFHVTLMSRRGILPEADFYCPIPYAPLQHLTPEAMRAHIAEGSAGLLDRAFALLAAELAEADPAYAADVALGELSADTFHRAYFAARMARDPFESARANLAEVRENYARRHTVAWRYCILRGHEVFSLATPHFTLEDRKRFNAGLKSVFIDNYAAIPPESIERMLAMQAAGALTLRALGESYRIARAEDGMVVTQGKQRLRFDHLVDARGQSELGIDDVPFPSLRLKLKANRLAAINPQAPASVQVEESYALSSGLNPVPGVYFLSLPFLLGRNPFIQGLCSAHDMGEIVAAHIVNGLSSGSEPDPSAEATGEVDALKQLRDTLRVDHAPLYCLDSGLVVLS